MELKVHRDTNDRGNRYASGRRRAELPVLDCAHRRLFEVGISQGSADRHGSGISGVAYGDHEQDNPLTVFHSFP